MKSWIWRWGPAVLVMMIIFMASSTPGPEMPEFGNWDMYAKKAGHMIGYALMAVAYLRALYRNKPFARIQLIAPLCLAFLYAVSDEWHQSFVPGRNSSLLDVVIDTAGSILGLAVWPRIRTCLPSAHKAAETRGKQRISHS